MKFSQRIGKTPVKVELEREGLSPELKNLLWKNVDNMFIKQCHSLEDIDDLWLFLFEKPIDRSPLDGWGRECKISIEKLSNKMRMQFYEVDWFIALDFIEFSAQDHPYFQQACNSILESEMSAYRFVNGQLVEINSREEVIEIEDAIKNTDQFRPVKIHLEAALALISNRKNPDCRNSMKESISAVEALAKIITKNEKATLGQALKEMEVTHKIPTVLKIAFDKLYGYTSDQGGIRHALTEKSVEITLREARFMLVTCSAFVNYLIK
jgi:hypothetical protein